MGDLIFYGDPHGEWRPLLRACRDHRPEGIVILGDCDLAVPLRKQLHEIFDLGIQVLWIPGNHDADTPEFFDHLWGDYPLGNLHGRCREVAGMKVAGLGGVFKARIWYPRFESVPPAYSDRRDYLRDTPRRDRWRGGLPLRVRDAIFPEDVTALRNMRTDIMVSHEAPSYHLHGFVGIDAAAELCRARLIVHGHHHESYETVLPSGTRVRGLAIAEVLRLRREDLD